MTALLRSRSLVAIALTAALVPVPGLAAPVSSSSAPTASAPTTTSGATTSPSSTAPTTPAPTDATAPAPTDATTPPADGTTPAEGDAPVDAVPVEEKKEPEKVEETPPAVPEGPERPAEPTLGNGKFKAKGTGLLISGGVLLGLGAAGIITTVMLTRCPDLDNSFGCKQHHNNTFAVPGTGAVALLGAVLLIVGATYRARYRRWENWDPKRAKTAFYPTLMPHGGGVGTVVNF